MKIIISSETCMQNWELLVFYLWCQRLWQRHTKMQKITQNVKKSALKKKKKASVTLTTYKIDIKSTALTVAQF